MKANSNLSLVGNLQVMAQPSVSLYVDAADRSLSLFFRISPPSSVGGVYYVVASVSPGGVRQYMERSIVLATLFKKGTYRYARMKDGDITFDDGSRRSVYNLLRRAGKFEPDLCYDDVLIKSFLSRYKN